MKTIKQLKKEIDNKDEGCNARKMYTTEGAVRFYTCGRMIKCPNCGYYLTELKAKLSQTKEIVKMIEDELEHREYIEDTSVIPLLESLILKLKGEEK